MTEGLSGQVYTNSRTLILPVMWLGASQLQTRRCTAIIRSIVAKLISAAKRQVSTSRVLERFKAEGFNIPSEFRLTHNSLSESGPRSHQYAVTLS